MSKVEVLRLGEIEDLGLVKLGRGNIISKNDILSCPGDYPVFSSSSSNNGEIGSYGKFMFDDERITWSIDGGGKLFYRNNLRYSVTNVCGWLKVLDARKLNTKYLYYLFSNQWSKLIFNYSHKAHPSVVRNEYFVPNVDIKVQEEIVKILDSFTNLIDALNEELSLRQKQFEYYRDKLFDDLFMKSKGVDILSFSDFDSITRGKRFVRDDIRTQGQPCIHYGDMYTYYGAKAEQAKTYLDRDFPKKMRYANHGDVIIVGAGENNWDIGVGLAWFGEEPVAVHDACYIIKHQINPMFISYYTRTTEYHQQLKQCVSEGKICSFSAEGLGKVKIPVPTDNTIQQSIVEKLDAFESLISSLKEEIELRQKQYEYYREKLLTFE